MPWGILRQTLSLLVAQPLPCMLPAPPVKSTLYEWISCHLDYTEQRRASTILGGLEALVQQGIFLALLNCHFNKKRKDLRFTNAVCESRTQLTSPSFIQLMKLDKCIRLK